MRVAICADMVGVSGIDRYEQCFPSWAGEYRHGVRMIVGDVRAAAEAAFAAGADEVVLADWHHLGRNLPTAAFPGLPVRRLWERGRPTIGPEALNRPDAAIFVGCHAGAGHPEGFLSHTVGMGMSVALDGEPLSEAGLWALALGGGGVPVAVISGDQRAMEEAAASLPGIRAVGVKAGTSRTSAILRDPGDAREELAEAVAKSLVSPPEPVIHPFPATATIRFADPANARRAASRAVGELTGPRDVSARLGSVHDLMPFAFRGLLATRLGASLRAVDRLQAQGRGAGARARSAGVLALTGWAERRVVRAWAAEPAGLFPPVGGPSGPAPAPL
ncbi:MAG TPA: M55 family metallopeptidase [Actinomycetota bacterium]